MRENALSIMSSTVTALAPHLGGHVRSIQIAAALSGGYSGAPVIDARGELVGVVTENTEERVHGDAQPTRVTHAAPAEYIAAFTSG